ncbi:Na(+)/H(+) exchange regulatory cofactor NHE-RF1-like [Rhipicephalus microplus]|uniref:Na(+)/H(+) exchange regulatory cofactor NHE-RF1-like n=1 Tax=Rhipicephalus microplus TaxID=6941 RepID=UPI003F6B4D91
MGSDCRTLQAFGAAFASAFGSAWSPRAESPCAVDSCLQDCVVPSCPAIRRPEYDGYGFKLIPATQGYLPRLSAVEPGSPAEAAGLRSNDTVVEVNGAILDGLGHEDVVQLVKSTPNEARLVVVDDETAAWYKRRGIALRGDNLNVVRTSSKNSSRKELAGGLRLCYLRKWPDYEGYGFSLREYEENFFITAVVPDSPAELRGLRNDDRLIEVNAVSVENRSY